MIKCRVLIVDDEMIIRNSLERIISRHGNEIILAETGREAIDKARSEKPDIVFLDYRLPDLDGLEVLKRIKAENPDVLVLIFSAYGTLQTVVEAMKLGAFDYIQKPYQNEQIVLGMMKAAEALKLKREVKELRVRGEREYRCEQIVVNSEEMKRLLGLAVKVGRSGDTPVLIEGETGVGKEVIAQVIHRNSRRSHFPLITVNCGAIPKGLAESELFGYEKGAFTGALSSGKAGWFELGDGGTLFLDEVTELSENDQVKLLRVVEAKRYFRVGGGEERKADVRIISATNRNPELEVQEGRFREDLYYRLNVVRIKVPPLRERKSDIIPLAKHFVERFNDKFGKKITEITPRAQRELLSYQWKGNVRELRNVVERSVMLSTEELIDTESLILNSSNSSSGDDLVINLSKRGISLEEVNRLLIEKALILSDNNVVKAAKVLGIERGALRHRIKKYKIKLPVQKIDMDSA